MSQTVADEIVTTLATAGVRRIYGIVGDSLNPITDSLHRQREIDQIHVRHEEAAAFAAGPRRNLRGNWPSAQEAAAQAICI